MDKLSSGVFVLFVLLVPVSSTDIFLAEPMVCYFLDVILVVYCVVATGLYFREKFIIPTPAKATDDNGGIYQELDRAKDQDAYQVLEPTKAKKKVKKRKTESTSAEERDKDAYETLNPSGSDAAPPLSPH
ncbi:T-cell surface glycoprotein CD3 zeta chain-like [Centropristis striata]|uniref:T-cell surface glycoprotein CD3 zeta chain-like n=1 Tax=Centropristis striata TaxID=184440 RepID=UPI0027E0A718|nr:T-cell surface glycoprotein CD3 zeta chain-like [Centropristis striata]